MRLVRYLLLCACLLLSSSAGLSTRIAPEYAQGLLLVSTIEGCRVWMDRWPSGAHFTWSGGCSGSQRMADGVGRLDMVISGLGLLITRFDGTISRGHKSPHGREFRPNTSYRLLSTRDWADGRFGHGTEIIDGVRYAGGFQGDVRAGFGYMTWPNGDIHRGGWRNGLPNGYGEVRMGKKLVAGQWRDGCLLDSARIVAVAAPLDACRGLVAAPNLSAPGPDVVMPSPNREGAAEGGGGCVPVEPGSMLRLCK
jgi:hypothetical protein